MFDALQRSLRPLVSGERAYESLRALTRFHRIQSTPGYDEAARWLADEARAAGLEVEVVEAAGDGRTRFDGTLLPGGWRCERAVATLHGRGGAEALCDFGREPLSVVQRSAPARGRFRIVALRDGTERAHYDGLDVRGAVVLTSGAVQRVHALAVIERGAAGILTDTRRLLHDVRRESDERDALNYASFWWTEAMPRGWGFVVTPERGAELRRRLEAGERLELEAEIASAYYESRVPLVSARVPGRGRPREEVLVLAHLCHPAPGANDNGSGVVAALETGRALGALARTRAWTPRRSVRFLWVPEIHGTAAWLALRPETRRRTVAALNLDMVGADQDQTGSTLLLEHPPHFTASFAEELLAHVRRGALDWIESYSGPGHVSHTRLAEVPFGGGSDHILLVDPVVGIPCPMLIQWPDRFYHSNHDTLDRCSPGSLAHAARTAAAYAAILARDDAADRRALAALVERGAARRALEALDREEPTAFERERRRGLAAIASLERAGVPAATRAAARRRFAALERLHGTKASRRPGRRSAGPGARVPVRTRSAPLDLLEHLVPGWDGLDGAERDAWRDGFLRSPLGALGFELAWFACDGRRDLEAIAETVRIETGKELAVSRRAGAASLEAFFERTARLGLSRWKGGRS